VCGSANSNVTITSPLTTSSTATIEGALNAQNGIVLSADKFITCGTHTSISSLLHTTNNYINIGSYREVSQSFNGTLTAATSSTNTIIATAPIDTLGVYMACFTFLCTSVKSTAVSYFQTVIQTTERFFI
jgi:hypothetical protein